MTSKLALLLSMIMVLVFTFIKTRDKITLAGASVALLTFIAGVLQDNSYNEFFSYIPIGTVNDQKTALFIIDFIVIIIFLVYVFYRSEKYRGTEKGTVVPDFSVLLEPEKGNVIFWILLVVFNFIVFLMGNN